MLTETQNQAKYNVHNIEISVIGIVPINFNMFLKTLFIIKLLF